MSYDSKINLVFCVGPNTRSPIQKRKKKNSSISRSIHMGRKHPSATSQHFRHRPVWIDCALLSTLPLHCLHARCVLVCQCTMGRVPMYQHTMGHAPAAGTLARLHRRFGALPIDCRWLFLLQTPAFFFFLLHILASALDPGASAIHFR